MSIERKHDLTSFYEQYEGRRPVPPDVASKIEKVDLKLDKSTLIRFVTDLMPEIARGYDQIKKGDSENTVSKSKVIDGEGREIKRAELAGGSRVRFGARKIYGRVHDDFVDIEGTYPPHYAGEEFESIFFELFNREEEIGGYRLDRDLTPVSSAWALNDRMVLDKYREQGFGSVLFSATKSFIQNYASEHGVPQKITANTGQPSVLLMLLNKGFVPSTDEDRRNMEMVLGADQALELDYAVFKTEIFEDDKPTGTYEYKTETFKDLYVFKKGTDRKIETNAVRINLEKVFDPKQTQAQRTRDDVREGVQAVTRVEQIKEAVGRLHPSLREALAHPLGISALSTFPTPSGKFDRQNELLHCIDSLNEMVSAFIKYVENPPHVAPREAKRLMEYVTGEASLLSEGGMLQRILIAFEVFAKTKLRELAKKPSSDPFNEEEFAKEQMIHGFITDLCGGINTSRGFSE